MARASTWLTPESCSARSNVSTAATSSKARASASPPSSALSIVTVVGSGPRGPWTRGQPSTSPSPTSRRRNMESKVILLVEDNPRDEALTLRALKKSNIVNDVNVVRDGVEAVDYLFGTETHAEREMAALPQLVLLDLKLPKVDGLEVLRRIRADERTKRLPVVVFTSSSEEEDMIKSYELGANSYVRKPVESEQFADATKQLGLYWLVLNEAPPTA